jgi:DNA-binding CsgD family transcriptional regulator
MRGTVDEATYDQEYARITAEKRSLETELERVVLQLADESQRQALLQEVERAVTQLPEMWEELNPEERRHLLGQVIEYCWIEPIGGHKHRVWLKLYFLPEIVEELLPSKSRLTGLFDDVAHLTQRELAYLALASEGWSEEKIRTHWQVTPQATYFLRKSLLQRLGVVEIEEAVRLARGRIEREREALPLGPTDWHPGRGRRTEGELRPRVAEALRRYIETQDEKQVAQAMGITLNTAKCQLWHARHELGCATVAAAAEKYLELNGGQLPPFVPKKCGRRLEAA